MTRPRTALVVAGAALVCALVAAIGPADHLRMRYSWPPRELSEASPMRVWYAPLLLSRHQPKSLAAEFPCSSVPALRDTQRPVVVLATARDWEASQAFAITQERGRFDIHVGTTTVAQVQAGTRPRPGCSYHFVLRDRGWFLTGGPDNVKKDGRIEQMPSAVGLFSGVDLHSDDPPRIELTSTAYGSETRVWQAVLWIAAVLGAIAALLLALRSGPRPRSRSPGRLLTLKSLGFPDAVVGVALLGWWLIGPAFYDDGWVQARQANFSDAGGFSAYYSSFGVNLPLDYWLEWMEHWLVESSTALLVLRLPALFCLAATWALCRWTFGRVIAPGVPSRAAVWALVSAFIVGAFAWGMTARPEPVLALLVAGAVASTLRFVERQSAVALVVALLLVVLALSAHPAGIVSIAPLIVAAPVVLRWTRAHRTLAATAATAATTLLVVLVTVGSDAAQRRADAASLRAFGDETAGWRDELNRYTLLGQAPYGAPLRRESVALIALAVLAYVFRRRRGANPPLLGFAASSLGVALLLLLATPTKWPWHFGALVGVAAVAVAAETFRLVDEARQSKGWDARPLVALAAAVAAAAWSWNPRLSWGELDLQTLNWTLGFESRLTLSKVAGALPIVLLAALAIVEGTRRNSRISHAPWRAAALIAPVLAVPLIAFTAAMLLADSARADSWTLARQNVETLRGDLQCGLADDAVVASRSSMRPLAPVEAKARPTPEGWLPTSPVNGLERFALSPAPSGLPRAHSPWFRLPPGGRIGFFVSGTPRGSDQLELEWGRVDRATVRTLGTAGIATGFGDDAMPEAVDWRFYAAGSLPASPSEANAVRFVARAEQTPGPPIGLTAPVSYENEPLANLLERERPVLALPNLLPYVPCVKQPRVGATAEVPRAVVAFRTSLWPIGAGTSPFEGVVELYSLVRLPLSDSIDPPGDVAIYEVDRRIEGAIVAPPTSVTDG